MTTAGVTRSVGSTAICDAGQALSAPDSQQMDYCSLAGRMRLKILAPSGVSDYAHTNSPGAWDATAGADRDARRLGLGLGGE